jgi:hypothetical protein
MLIINIYLFKFEAANFFYIEVTSLYIALETPLTSYILDLLYICD